LGDVEYDGWLDRGGTALLKPCPEDWLDAYPVSNHVNKPANDDPACIERISGGLL
jgi:putative SOS response-associated peptidase YedK